jgi:hypothetical protein
MYIRLIATVLIGLGMFASQIAGQTPSKATELADLAFLSGCWQGPSSATSAIEEFYTGPSNNIMLGTTRYIRNGTVVGYEFTRVEKTANGILMTPYPGGRPSEHSFRLTSLQNGEAIFEAPEHDYPKRIIYRANPDGTRTARIDGGPDDKKGKEWLMSGMPCPGSRK